MAANPLSNEDFALVVHEDGGDSDPDGGHFLLLLLRRRHCSCGFDAHFLLLRNPARQQFQLLKFFRLMNLDTALS